VKKRMKGKELRRRLGKRICNSRPGIRTGLKINKRLWLALFEKKNKNKKNKKKERNLNIS
jgi:hypothetical protein